jgi:yihY family protein
MKQAKKIEKKIPFKEKISRLIDVIMPNLTRASVGPDAAQLAYFILLSIIPMILILTNVVLLLPLETAEVLDIVRDLMPADVFQVIEPTLESNLESGSGGAISIGVLAAFWSAGKVVSALRKSLDEIYGAMEKANFLVDRVLSVLVMFAIILLGSLGLFTFMFGEHILLFIQSIIGTRLPFIDLFLVLRWIVVAVLLPIVFIVVYHFVPNHHIKLKYAWPGAIFSSIGIIILSEFFTLYISLAGGDAVANATFGAFIALMIFLYFLNMIILFGGVLNAIVYEWQTYQSVAEFEREYNRQQEVENSDWPGYPQEWETTILRRKLYKASYLKKQNITQFTEIEGMTTQNDHE